PSAGVGDHVQGVHEVRIEEVAALRLREHGAAVEAGQVIGPAVSQVALGPELEPVVHVFQVGGPGTAFDVPATDFCGLGGAGAGGDAAKGVSLRAGEQ